MHVRKSQIKRTVFQNYFISIVADQDRGLEELSKIIGRQRQMAQAIGDEVESQNGSRWRKTNNRLNSSLMVGKFILELIENIADNVDRTRDRMNQQTASITLVDRKDRTCGKINQSLIINL